MLVNYDCAVTPSQEELFGKFTRNCLVRSAVIKVKDVRLSYEENEKTEGRQVEKRQMDGHKSCMTGGRSIFSA